MTTTEPTTIRNAPRDPVLGDASLDTAASDDRTLLHQLAAMLGGILGMPGLAPGTPVPASGEPFGPATRLGDDLELESIDLVTLAAHLEERYGERINLADFLAGLDIDSVIALTVGDVVAHVRAALGAPTPAED